MFLPLDQTEVNEAVPVKADADGVVRIAGTRVTLDTLVAAFREGATAEEITQQYPSISLADVYAVIGYYLRHCEKIDTYLEQRRAQRQKVRRENERRFDPHGIRERLLARRGRG
jgi:uncharacterized protein (DUF433 family)